MVRLVSMTEEEFRTYLERAVERRAERNVSRGFWKEERAFEAARRDLVDWLPRGFRTPHRHFVHIVDEATGSRLGESCYTVEDRGGKTQFWVDWITIHPELRRKGHATAALEALAHEAARAGADRLNLKVFADNPGAKALYLKLGFVEMATEMVLQLTEPGRDPLAKGEA